VSIPHQGGRPHPHPGGKPPNRSCCFVLAVMIGGSAVLAALGHQVAQLVV
jgi:hypothetical protein